MVDEDLEKWIDAVVDKTVDDVTDRLTGQYNPWILIKDHETLPPMDTVVLVFRQGGQNKHQNVEAALRRHKYGTRDEWEWVGTPLNSHYTYWGVSCDGREVTHWRPIPDAPGEVPSER